MNKISRREFIKLSALTATALSTGLSSFTKAEIENTGIYVVIPEHSQVISAEKKIDDEKLSLMLDESIRTLTGNSDLKSAWLSFFPNLQTNDVIGIKVNCINSKLSSHPQVVSAIVRNLVNAGINENNIIIFDRTTWELQNAGYTINTSDKGVRCFGTDTKGIGFDKETTVKINGQDVIFSTILSKMCNHLINVPVLKNHDLTGTTFALKNNYGCIPLGESLPGSALRIRAMHDKNGRYAAELNSVPIIKNKTRLIVGDALWGIYTGGPGGAPQWINNQLIVTIDPVAADYHAMLKIENKRKEKGVSSTVEKAIHIKLAAELGLGTNDPREIILSELKLG